MARYNTPRGPAGGGPQAPPRIPAPPLVKYFRSSGELDPELLDGKAEQWAKELAKVSSSQLRRFYEDVLALEKRLQVEAKGPGRRERDESFDRLRADFKMLKAKAVYAHGKNKSQFPEAFLQFFVDHVHSVDTSEKFKAFRKHFEAVVAFHKVYAKD